MLPVVEGLKDCGIPLSIDTYKSETMRQALQAGVDCVNDIWALRQDGSINAVLDRDHCGIILMHMQRDHLTMQFDPEYKNVIAEVKHFLRERMDLLTSSGIAKERIALDSGFGFGFGKSLVHNVSMLANFSDFSGLDFPILAGISRKSMLGKITGKDTNKQVAPSVAAAIMAADRGAKIIRVHDVTETVDALKIWKAIQG